MIALVAASSLLHINELPIRIGGALCHPHRLIVQGSVPSLPKAIGRILWNFPEINFFCVEADSIGVARKSLLKMKGVKNVDYDIAGRPAYDPNDPMWPDQWHLRTIKANLAWDHSFGSPTKVAVIDTGVQVDHPDLAANIWVNPGEIAGNGIDDDNNGYVDDVNGYDFAYLDSSPDDQYGHGTPCSGLVGAVQDNGIGVSGVAPRARIVALKACLDSGYFYNSMTIPAYMYAAHNGIRVLSMSYYCDDVAPGERTALEYCVANGIVPVAAAANENSTLPFYPAAYECVLSVAALNSNNTRAGFSNYGTWVDVAAPGVSLTTVARGGGYTNGFGGTSGACPHVAGLATLLFGANPLATPAEVRAAIEDTAAPLSSEFTNYGMVNSEAAMIAMLGTPAPAKAPRVRYLTPASFDMSQESMTELVARIHGRGFQSPNIVEVFANGKALPIVAQTRDWVDFELGSVRGNLEVRVNGNSVSTITLPTDLRKVYPMIEASSQTAGTSGGFLQTLHADGQVLTCGTGNDGNIKLQANFRLVKQTGPMTVELKRSYDNAGGTEKVYVYDWASWSFPYANWILIGSAPVGSGAWTSSYTISNPETYIDDDGTMYLYVVNESSGGGSLRLDSLRLIQN